MEIDIITFTDEQYATLTETQLQEVYKAQEKKDKLTWKLEEEKRAEKHRLVKNGTFASGIWGAYCTRLQERYDQEVTFIREALLFYLRFSMKTSEDAPYEVNYAYTAVERTKIVKEYYETTYTNASERFEAFKKDTVAAQYLGEMYAPLWDYFYLQTE